MWPARFWRCTAQDACALGAAGAWAGEPPLQSSFPLRGNSPFQSCVEVGYFQ